MADLKRLAVKYIRDGAKGRYTKQKECFICGSESDLQLHHFYSMTELWELWLRKTKNKVTSEEDVLNLRDDFISDNYEKIYNKVVTLCKSHHMDGLHKFFGKCPKLATAKSQEIWCNKQRDKLNNKRI